MTPSSSLHSDCNSFLAWQQIDFGDNPAGSKGFSRHSCHALQSRCNQGRSTRHGHSPSATCYIPHSPSSNSSASLHSCHTCRQLCMFTQPRRFGHSVILVPGSIYLLQQWFPAMTVHQLFFDSVKSRVFHSGHGSYTHFTAPWSRSSKLWHFLDLLSWFNTCDCLCHMWRQSTRAVGSSAL